MANEIQLSFQTGKTAYSVIRNQTSGYLWSLSGGVTGAFEAFTSGNWGNYAISLTEEGVTGYYKGNMPSALAAGVYAISAKQQLGASPVQTDPTVGVGDYQWNGSIVSPLSDTATSGLVGQFLPLRLFRGQMIQNFLFKMVSAADHITSFTSGVISGQIARDAGSFGVLQSGAFTEVGLGWYRTNLTSGDLLANTVALSFSANGISGGTADQRDFALVMQRTSGQ